MAKRPLESLPHFVEEAVADMSREPPYITATSYHLFTYNGIQVQLVLQRDPDDFIDGNPLFTKGTLK